MQRTGLEWAYEVGSVGMAYQVRVLQVAYLVLLGALAFGLVRSWRRLALLRLAGPRRQALWLAGVTALALVLRLLAPASPMDLHHRLDVAWYAWHLPAPYGWGLPVLAVALWSVVGRSHEVVFAANAVIGALTILPLCALGRRLGLSERARFWSALLLATMPLHVRFSHTDNQSIPEIALFLVALWALAAWADEQRWSLAALAGLCLGLGMTMRPEACVLAPVALGWLVAVRPPTRWRWRQVALGVAVIGVVAGGHAVAMTHMLIGSPGGQAMGDLPGLDALRYWDVRFLVFLNGDWVVPAVWAGLGVGLFARPIRLRVRVGLTVVAVGLALLVWNCSPLELGVLAARHQLRALPFVALLAGAGIDYGLALLSGGRRPGRLFGRRLSQPLVFARRAVHLVAATACAASLPLGLSAALRPTTVNLEWAFFAETLPRVPRCCTIVYYQPWVDRSLMTPVYLSDAVQARHRWIAFEAFDETRIAADECLLYYRSASCFAHQPIEPAPQTDGPHQCAGWEQRWSLRPVWTRWLQARTSGTDQFSQPSVQVGFFALGERATPPERGSCWAEAGPEGQPSRDGSAAPPPPDPNPSWMACSAAFTPEQGQALYRLVKGLPAGSCRFASLETVKERSQATWQDGQGREVHATLVAAECVRWSESTAADGGDVVLLESAEAEASCPEAYEGLRALVRAREVPAPVPLGAPGPDVR